MILLSKSRHDYKCVTEQVVHRCFMWTNILQFSVECSAMAAVQLPVPGLICQQNLTYVLGREKRRWWWWWWWGGGGVIEGGGMSCDTASLLTCLASSISESESEVWCLHIWSCASLLSKRSEYLSMRQPVTDPSSATVLNLFSTNKTVHPNYTFPISSAVKSQNISFKIYTLQKGVHLSLNFEWPALGRNNPRLSCMWIDGAVTNDSSSSKIKRLPNTNLIRKRKSLYGSRDNLKGKQLSNKLPSPEPARFVVYHSLTLRLHSVDQGRVYLAKHCTCNYSERDAGDELAYVLFLATR